MSMTDVQQWLSSIDLGQYADAFEENAIGWDLFEELTDDDLRAIGIAALGHRKRLLKAISEMGESSETTASLAPPLSRDQSVPGGEAERRQLTVMFCDLVGSTQLSQALDPEELREINRAYQDAAKASIEKFDGYVARYMGDGVLAYFGYPQAHEDDAERAVRAGLDLTESVPNLIATRQLAVRTGIATGPVVVGDLIGEGASQESAAVGETLNLAARIQGESEANTVTISEATRTLVAGLFDCIDLGACRLKGFADEQRLWRVGGTKRSESRFEALRSKNLTSFVGRDSELGMLLNRWESAVVGEGQVILIEGEAGIGKSRLADELRRAVASYAHTPIRYQCSPHYTNSAFFPFVSQLEHASNILRGNDSEERLDKLEQLLPESTPGRPKALWLFAKLLSLPTERYSTLTLEPQEVKSETIALFRSQLAAQCKKAPVLIVFEDLHWIDPTSLEVLDVLVQAGRDLPVLFIVTHRPEFESPWDAYGFVTRLQLNRLPRRDGTAIIHEVAGGKSLPDDVLQQILAKTDGVALFVEELTKTVLEGGLLREEASRYVLDKPLPELAIPSTLSDSLVARLDRLASAKEVAQVAACIGREFSFELLHSVTGLDESETRRALEQLMDNELINRYGATRRSNYIFKHALVQDAAYQSLLMKTRRRYHERIAHALEVDSPETVNTQPELLAHHCTKAELFDQAAEYWRRAGSNAYSRRANREATKCFDEALMALDQLPETHDNLEKGIDVRIDIRHALFALRQFGQILKRVQEAEHLAHRLGDRRRLARINSYLTQATSGVGDHNRAIAIGESALAVTEADEDFTSQVMTRFFLAWIHCAIGNFVQSIQYAHQVVAPLKGRHAREHFGLAGLPAVMARSVMNESLVEIGQFAEATSVAEEAMRIAEEADHPLSVVIALESVARVSIFSGRFGKAIVNLERAVELGRRWDLTRGFPYTAASLAQAYFLAGRFAEAMSLLDEVVRHERLRAFEVRLLGEAYLLAGRRETALDYARRALVLSQECKERGCEAWALRLLGEITFDPDAHRVDAAESYYCQSLSLAEELGMRPLVSHCHLDLGILYQQTERSLEAQEHLSIGTALFDEMGMRLPSRAEIWLKQGRTLQS